jgi:mannan endo-1,4-beta-mannosidase
VKQAGKIITVAGAALIILAVIGRLILGAYLPKPVKPATGGYMGVAEAGETTSYQAVNQFAVAVGRQPDIVLFYSSWKESFQERFAAEVHAHGATPFVQIDPGHTSLAAIAAGHSDAYLRSYADEVKAYGHSVIIGFAAEMNGDWDPWGYRHTPAAVFVAAWRHVVTVFRQQTADNVIWLWTINITQPGTGPAQNWWPGANYVTWVGIDGYYYKRDYTFDDAFLPTIAEVRIFTQRPIILSEIGIGPVAGQAAKIPDLFAGVRANHLLGFVWFDQTQVGGVYHQDWRLKDNSAGLAAFRRELKTYKGPGRTVSTRSGPGAAGIVQLAGRR